jgi:hypothetical protein
MLAEESIGNSAAVASLSRTMKTLIRAIALFAILTGSPSAAQTGDTVSAAARHRNQCRLAKQVLMQGHPANRREWASHYIMMCPEEAPEPLSRRWQTTTEIDLQDLVDFSFRIPDRRIYDAAFAVASSSSRPAHVRVAAMSLLARYADPRKEIPLDELRVPPDGRIRPILGGVVYGGHMPVSVPIGEVGMSVQRLFQQLADTAENPPAVRHAAAVLALTLGMGLRP